jgi:preprotein translocase subunit YajC
MYVIFYFLLNRPQQKKAKEHREMVTNLKKGDKIITSGGIYGVVTGMDDATLTVEISDKVRIKLVRGNIASVVGPTQKVQGAKDNKEIEKK